MQFQNFKLIGDNPVSLETGPMTVLIGPNGTGKSSILQGLALLKQSRGGGGLQAVGQYLNLGSYRELIHLQDEGRVLRAELSATYPPAVEDVRLTHPVFRGGLLTYRVEFGPGGGVIFSEGILSADDFVLTSAWRPSAPPAQTKLYIPDLVQFVISPYNGIASPFQIASSQPVGNTSSEEVQPLTNALGLILNSMIDQLERTYFVPAMRGLDRPAYEVMRNVPGVDLPIGEGTDVQAASVVNALAYQPELTQELADYLKAVLGENAPQVRHRLVAGGQISGETVRERLNINIVNEAFGLNQLLLPLLWLARSPSGSTITIEEPEIHLHPKAQVSLCGLFVRLLRERDRQIMLTTHSEHIVLGLLNEVSAGRLDAQDLAVYDFSRDDSATVATRLEVNEFGQISGGLKEFMEVDIESLGQLLDSRFRRTE